MIAADNSVTTLYQQLIEQVHARAEQSGHTWRSWADPSAASPAQFGDICDEMVQWKPTRMQQPVDFSGLERGLDISINAEFQQFFSVVYGAGLPVAHSRGHAELLMVWHDADLQRLQQNLVAHVLMKRKLKQRDTLFFAVTDDDDYMISVLNNTGEVYLERVGHEVEVKLADSIADFLAQLSPRD